MKRKPVILREAAIRDIEGAITHYVDETARDAALSFVEALEHAVRRIGDHPGSGSPRYGYEVGMPGVRHLMLERHPYLVFYVEADDHVGVLRVLHARRDVPGWLTEGT